MGAGRNAILCHETGTPFKDYCKNGAEAIAFLGGRGVMSEKYVNCKNAVIFTVEMGKIRKGIYSPP